MRKTVLYLFQKKKFQKNNNIRSTSIVARLQWLRNPTSVRIVFEPKLLDHVAHATEMAYLSMLHVSLRVADRRVAHLDPRRLRRYVTVLICRHQNDVTERARRRAFQQASRKNKNEWEGVKEGGFRYCTSVYFV